MIALIGCGHRDCGDDATGLLVAKQIERKHLPRVRVRVIGTDGMAMLQAWEGCDACIVVDAMVGGGTPGDVMVLNETSWDLLRVVPEYSTHSIGPARALRLSAALGLLPSHTVVIGVEGVCFEPGSGLTPAVSAGIGRAAELVLAEILKNRG